MDKRARNAVMTIAVMIFALTAVNGYAGDDRFSVPRVAYAEPHDQSVADLTGKDALTFRWNEVPMPVGGREGFRFRIYKGFTSQVVAAETPGGRTFSIDVPAGKFEDGGTYTWRIQQRDGRSMIWSLYDTWSFKVVKKNK